MHAKGARRRTAVCPEVRARLKDEQGRTLVLGEVGLNAGMRIYLGMFLGILLLFAFLIRGQPGSLGFMAVVFAIFFGLMASWRSLGGEDFGFLARRLAEATDGTAPVA